ncbi:591035b0-54be-491e-8469-e266ad678ad4 [Sclerotinia trifoliorum]|uniref:Kinesin-like protein n=1 Tax=Sclerotinia trifoliorum TaxID=28548 RepID=A0A8H2VYP7_9HELO|nr:591035b0-54be-491e-8469-e266ad678ad4 [Sclerotinia trifoliorum]
MEPSTTNSKSALFEVYLRLRPPPISTQHLYPTLPIPDRFLTVEEPTEEQLQDGTASPTHITLNPPNDNRRRAVEKFAFTRVFEEESSQLDLFHGTGVLPLVEGVLGQNGGEGRDGLLATLGVTGSGKSHTILGSRHQRGLTQLALDLLFRSIDNNILDVNSHPELHGSIASSDPSEAQVMSAQMFLDTFYFDPASSRAPTPQVGDSYQPTPRRTIPTRPSALPSSPDITDFTVDIDHHAEYSILISMYEVYNDRIFDLLTPAVLNKSTKESRRRPLLFKFTEQSPDRKVVAGLRKIICGGIKDALMVLEAGLNERRVAGTNSNSTSSRSHGFFCVEVKKRRRSRTPGAWGGSSLTVVDLAGSERARDAKTAGATLAEAGKINESLMYLGQCLQMQSDFENNTKPNLVPFRQCKLTELLFSNSFPSQSAKPLSAAHHHRNPQKAIMIVTADPLGDFNATSQILRYSALAKEITVPRVPSITATILGSSQSSDRHPSFTSPTSPTFSRYRDGPPHTPTDTERETMEIAALEIARMSEEIDGLRSELERETRLRMESEAHLQSMEDRMLELEMDIREECYGEMERRIQEEARKWMVRLEEHGEREEEWRDRKVEVLIRGFSSGIYADEDKENQNEGVTARLEMENAKLLREVERLKRDLNSKSPTKNRKPSNRILKESRTHAMDKSASPIPDDTVDEGLELRNSMAKLKVDDDAEVGLARSASGKLRMKKSTANTGSPTKKVRKLVARKWDMADDDDL